jgi:hypothetical protein
MPYNIELPNGTLLRDIPDDVSRETVNKQILKAFPEIGASRKRSFGELATDTGASLASGIGRLAQVPGQLAFQAGLTEREETPTGLQGVGAKLEKFGEELKSPTLKGKEAVRNRKIAEADERGMLAGFGTAFKETIKDPALLGSFFFEQVPGLIGTGGVGLIAKGTAKALMVGATEQALAKIGVGGAIGAGAAQQGADVGHDTYETIYNKLIKQGMDKTEANGIALAKGRVAAIEAAALSIGASRLPGGSSIERALVGKGLPGAGGFIKGAVGEGLSESIEEGGGKFASNVGVREVFPETSLTQGVGSAAGMGALGGALFGGPAGILNARDTAKRQEMADYLSALDTTKKQAAQQAEQKKSEEPLALGMNKPFVPVGLPDGSVAMTQEDLDTYEDQKFAKQYAPQPVEEFKPATIDPLALGAGKPFVPVSLPDGSVAMTQEDLDAYEETKGLDQYAPVRIPEIIGQDTFKEMGIGGASNIKIKQQLIGKDLRDPVQAQEVKNILETYAGAKNRSTNIIKGVEAFLSRPEFKALEQGEANAPTTNIEPAGVSPEVSGLAGAEPPAAGTTATNRKRVGKPDTVITEPEGRTKDGEPPLTQEEIDAANVLAKKDVEEDVAEDFDSQFDEQIRNILSDDFDPSQVEIDEAPVFYPEGIKPPPVITPSPTKKVKQQKQIPVAPIVEEPAPREPETIEGLQSQIDYLTPMLETATGQVKKDLEGDISNLKTQIAALRPTAPTKGKGKKRIKDAKLETSTGNTNEKLVEHLQAGNITRALNEIATNKTDFSPIENLVANRILSNKMFKIPSFELVDSSQIGGDSGLYSPYRDKIFIARNSMDSHTVLHETVHAFLHSYIIEFELGPIKSIPIQNIKDIYDHVLKVRPDLAKAYGMESLTEFASEVMSNKQLQNILKEIPYRRENILYEFARAVMRLLGLSDSDTVSAFGSALIAVESAFNIGRNFQETQVTGRRAEAQEVNLDSNEFKKWFGDSKIVNADGTPKVMYHGTSQDISEFKPKQANAIFLTDKPKFAENFSLSSEHFMQMELLGKMSPEERKKLDKQAEKLAKKNNTLAEEEFSNLMRDRLPSFANIIPVYVKAENPFDFENLTHISELEEFIKLDAEERSFIKMGNWKQIEGARIQKAIRDAGFDAFYVWEGGTKNLAVYNSNQIKSVFNKTPTSSPDIAKLIKQDLDDLLKDSGYVSPKKEQPSAFQSIKQIDEAKAKSELKNYLNKFQTMYFSSDAGLSNRIREELDKQGTDWDVVKDMMYQVSTSQSLHSDAVANKFLEMGDIEYDTKAFKFYAKDDPNGYSWKNIIGKIDEIAKQTGLSAEDVNKYANQALIANRLKGLSKTNQDVYSHLTPAQIEAGLKLFDKLPQLREVQDIWNGVRKNAMKVAVDAGLYSPKQAEDLLKYMDFVPFYRADQIASRGGPREYNQGLLDFAKNFKIKGSEEPVADIFDNMERWTSYTVSRAVKNRTALNMYNIAKQVFPDEVKDLRQDERVKREQNVVELWVNGQRQKVEFTDPLFVHAFEGVQSVAIPSLTFMAKTANVFRKSIVLNPLFSASQLSQDAISAMFTSGLKQPFRIPLEVMSEFIKTLSGTSAAAKELTKYGAVGIRDYSSVVARTDAELAAGFRQPSKWEKLLSPFEKFAMASDNAVRQALYNRTLAEGGTKAQAIERAFEVINFKRAGAAAGAQALRQVVPFLGAYLQAQNVMYKTLTGKGISPSERKAAHKTLMATTAKVMALMFIYTALVSDDEEYQDMDPNIRDRHLLIPGTGFMLPLRPDLTLLPKLVAEYTYLSLTDNGFTDSKKVRRAMSDAVVNAISSPTLLPQVFKPPVEVMVNYDFFSGRPTIGMGIANKPTEQQFTNTTSEFAKFIGSSGLIAPVNVDHLVKGFFGTTGGLGLMITNAAVNSVSDIPPPEKSWRDAIASIPGAGAFVSKENGNAMKNDFYELRGDVTKAVNGLSSLKDNPEEAMKFFEANKDLIKLKSQVNSINNQLTKLRAYEKYIRDLPESKMTGAEKKEKLDAMKKNENAMLRNVNMLRKLAYNDTALQDVISEDEFEEVD